MARRNDPSLSDRDRISGAERLQRLGLHGEAKDWFDAGTQGGAIDQDAPSTKARYLESVGRRHEADLTLQQASVETLFQGYLFPGDEKRLRFALGDDWVDAKLQERARLNEDPYDQIWQARECVEKIGDRVLLGLLQDRVADQAAPSDERLEAIKALDDLGMRSLFRARITSLQGDEIGPGNFAAQLIRSARKADAVAFLSSLDESLIDQDDFTCVVMAEVGLSTKLAEVHRLRGERSPSGCDTVAN